MLTLINNAIATTKPSIDLIPVDITWSADLVNNLQDLLQPDFNISLGDYYPAILNGSIVQDKLISLPGFTDVPFL